MTVSPRTALAGIELAAVTAAVIGGFLVVDSPQDARLQRLDDRRVSDLRQWSGAIDLYWTRRHDLPDSLDMTMKELARTDLPVDPVTAQPYEYRRIEGPSYELCAAFDRASREGSTVTGDPLSSHGAGRQCFTLRARTFGQRGSRPE